MYWSTQAKAALDALLLDASRDRCLYRVAIEPSERFMSEQKGGTQESEQPDPAKKFSGEAIITRYRGGIVERIATARTAPDYASIEWTG